MTDDQAYRLQAVIRDAELEISMKCEASERLKQLAKVCGSPPEELAAAMVEELFGPDGNFFVRRSRH